MSPKAYADRAPPSEALTIERRQENAAEMHVMILEDIEDGFLDAAAGWQNHRAAFYARARYQFGLRESDYDE